MPKGMPIIVRQQKVPNIIESMVAQTPTKSIYAMRVRFVLLDFTIEMPPLPVLPPSLYHKSVMLSTKKEKNQTHITKK